MLISDYHSKAPPNSVKVSWIMEKGLLHIYPR